MSEGQDILRSIIAANTKQLLLTGNTTSTLTNDSNPIKAILLDIDNFETRISSIKLMDASADVSLRELLDGVMTTPTTPLTIQAFSNTPELDSVTFHLNGPISFTATEKYYPYALFGDSGISLKGPRNLDGRVLPEGNYHLRVTPYFRGNAGPVNDLSFTLQYILPEVTSFYLIEGQNSLKDTELKNGDIINLEELSSKNQFTIKATTSSGKLDSLKIKIEGPINHQQTERLIPYALFGDFSSASGSRLYHTKMLITGDYTLTAIPFYAEVAGESKVVHFKAAKLPTIAPPGDISLLPVPTQNTLNIRTFSDNLKWYRITDYNGQKVMQGNNTSNLTLDVSHLKSGIYLLHIFIDEKIEIRRFVKE